MLGLGKPSRSERTPTPALQIHWLRCYAVVPLISVIVPGPHLCCDLDAERQGGKKELLRAAGGRSGSVCVLGPGFPVGCHLLSNVTEKHDQNVPTPHSFISYFPQCGYEIYTHTHTLRHFSGILCGRRQSHVFHLLALN